MTPEMLERTRCGSKLQRNEISYADAGINLMRIAMHRQTDEATVGIILFLAPCVCM